MWSADWMPHIRRSRYVDETRKSSIFIIYRNPDWIPILFRASWWSCRRLWNPRSLLLPWSTSQTGSTFFGRQSLIVFIIQWIDSHFLVFVETNFFQGAEAWNLGQAVPGVGGALQVRPRKGSCCVRQLRLVEFCRNITHVTDWSWWTLPEHLKLAGALPYLFTHPQHSSGELREAVKKNPDILRSGWP